MSSPSTAPTATSSRAGAEGKRKKRDDKTSSAPGGSVRGSADKDDRKGQILRAAARVFADKGYHECRISDVADEAGVAYGLVYHYFGTKDGLLAAIFDANWAFFARAIDDCAPDVVCGPLSEDASTLGEGNLRLPVPDCIPDCLQHFCEPATGLYCGT